MRNFSYNNGKQIGLYNIEKKLFIDKAALKNQACRNFFYGEDGEIEDTLAKIEGHLATIIRDIISTTTLPHRRTEEHWALLTFIALMDLRNPVKIDSVKDHYSGMAGKAQELGVEEESLRELLNVSHEEAVAISLSGLNRVVSTILDLDYKLVVNQTQSPFITSDLPIVKYNQFLEGKSWQFSSKGYGAVGLQIFIPLNSELAIILYDSEIYKVGMNKPRVLYVVEESDEFSLNLLQSINCKSQLFFDEKVDQSFIEDIMEKSSQFSRANIASVTTSYLLNSESDHKKGAESNDKNLIMFTSSDCKIGLKIAGISVHAQGKNYKLNSTVGQLRKNCSVS